MRRCARRARRWRQPRRCPCSVDTRQRGVVGACIASGQRRDAAIARRRAGTGGDVFGCSLCVDEEHGDLGAVLLHEVQRLRPQPDAFRARLDRRPDFEAALQRAAIDVQSAGSRNRGAREDTRELSPAIMRALTLPPMSLFSRNDLPVRYLPAPSTQAPTGGFVAGARQPPTPRRRRSSPRCLGAAATRSFQNSPTTAMGATGTLILPSASTASGVTRNPSPPSAGTMKGIDVIPPRARLPLAAAARTAGGPAARPIRVKSMTLRDSVCQ